MPLSAGRLGARVGEADALEADAVAGVRARAGAGRRGGTGVLQVLVQVDR
jgi:hypothetical protein